MMPHLLLRIAIALVTFGAGLMTATVFSAIFGATPATPVYESVRPTHRKRPCPNSRQSLNELPPLPAMPAMPEAPEPPPPPAKPTVSKRVTIKLSDGTVRVIESRVEETVER